MGVRARVETRAASQVRRASDPAVRRRSAHAQRPAHGDVREADEGWRAAARPAGGGRPLDARLRARMETMLGAELDDVRVHWSGWPASHGAEALTQGTHVHLDPARVPRGGPRWRHVLGHELAHVVQQRRGRVPGAASRLLVDDRLEAEADAAGAAAAAGRPARGPMSQESGANASAIGARSGATSARASAPAPARAPIQPMLASRRALSRHGGSSVRLFSSAAGGGGGDRPPRRPWRPPKYVDDTVSERAKEIERAKRFREMLERQRRLRELNERARARHGGRWRPTESSFRFDDVFSEDAMKSPVEKKHGSRGLADTLAAMARYRALADELHRGHETGSRHDESPFVSVAKDPMRVVTTSDPWLASIAEKAPHLALIRTPAGTLRPPVTDLSRRETEHLFTGGGLMDHVARVIPNPMLGGIPRFGALPPDVVGAMMGMDQPVLRHPDERAVGRRLDQGRESQHRRRIERMRRKLAEKKKDGGGGGSG